jgi:hypothetical protein
VTHSVPDTDRVGQGRSIHGVSEYR